MNRRSILGIHSRRDDHIHHRVRVFDRQKRKIFRGGRIEKGGSGRPENETSEVTRTSEIFDADDEHQVTADFAWPGALAYFLTSGR